MLRVTMHNNIFIKRDIKKYFFDSVELKGKSSHYGKNVQCKNISGGQLLLVNDLNVRKKKNQEFLGAPLHPLKRYHMEFFLFKI